MNRNRFYWLPLFLIVCSITVMSASADPIPPQVTTILDSLTASASHISSLSYHLVTVSKSSSSLGKIQSISEHDILQNGWLRASADHSHIQHNDGKRVDQDDTRRVVFNQSYFALTNSGTKSHIAGVPEVLTPFGATQWFYDANLPIPNSLAMRIEVFTGIDILRYGLGDGRTSSRVPQYIDPNVSKWEVADIVDPDGVKRTHLTYTDLVHSANPNFATFLWVIDPNQGGLISHGEQYCPGSRSILYQVDITNTQESPDIFLPTHVHTLDYQGRLGAAVVKSLHLTSPDEPSGDTDMTFSKIVVNPDLAESQFTLSYLQLPDGAQVGQLLTNGKHQSVIKSGDHFVPMEKWIHMSKADQLQDSATTQPDKK